MVFLGAGEVSGSFIMGVIIDKIGAKKSSLINVAIVVTMVVITANNIQNNYFGTLSFAMCFIWGFLDGSINAHCY
jgi:predicted MFS family arabinose efflux permease